MQQTRSSLSQRWQPKSAGRLQEGLRKLVLILVTVRRSSRGTGEPRAALRSVQQAHKWLRQQAGGPQVPRSAGHGAGVRGAPAACGRAGRCTAPRAPGPSGAASGSRAGPCRSLAPGRAPAAGRGRGGSAAPLAAAESAAARPGPARPNSAAPGRRLRRCGRARSRPRARRGPGLPRPGRGLSAGRARPRPQPRPRRRPGRAP